MNNKTFTYYPVIKRGNTINPVMEFRFPAYDKYDPATTIDEWNLCELKRYLSLDVVLKNLINLEMESLPDKCLMMNKISYEINLLCVNILTLLSSLCNETTSITDALNLMKPTIKKLIEVYIANLKLEFPSSIIDSLGFNNICDELS